MRLRNLLWVVLGLITIGAAACRIYDDSGTPIPSSDWSWQCPDGTPAPDAGCPLDGGVDGGDDDDTAAVKAQ